MLDHFSNHKYKYIITLLICTSLIILNEVIAYITSLILNFPYLAFPQSFWINYTVIDTGNGLAIIFSLLTIGWALGFIIGVLGKNTFNHIMLACSLGLLLAVLIGNSLFTFLDNGIFSISPLHFFTLYMIKNSLTDINLFYVSYTLGFIIGCIFILISSYKKIMTQDKVHGNAHWATMWDMIKYKLFIKNIGTLKIGKWNGFNIWLQGFAPLLVIANVGAGKSTALAIQAILNWYGSGIHNDTANELYEITARYLRKIGYSVYQFSPMSRKTHRFNPFHHACSLPIAERWGVIERICLKIIPTTKNESSKSWSSMARRVLEGLAAYLISTTGYCTLGQLAEICCKANFNEWLKKEIINNDTVDAQFKVNANAFLNIDADQTQGGVKFNYEAYIGLYLNPIIRAATEYSDFDISKLRKEKMHIFLGIPDGEMAKLEPLITMFWEEISAVLMQKVPDTKEEPYPVLFNIDEFGNSGRLDRIRKNLTTLRKYRVRSIIYLQYKDQVGQDFTREEAHAFNSIPNKVLLSATGSIDDAKYFSDLFGQKTIKYHTKSNKAMRFEENTNEHYHKRPLITQDELMTLNDKEGLLHIAGKNPIKFKKSYYFKDRNLVKKLGKRIEPNVDSSIPEQEPIEPTIDLSMAKKPLTQEEKLAKKLEREEKAQHKHECEMEKIRVMTSMVLDAVKQPASAISDFDEMQYHNTDKDDV